jgi:hypothetical protein
MKVKSGCVHLGKRENGITSIVLKELESRKIEIGKFIETVPLNW